MSDPTPTRALEPIDPTSATSPAELREFLKRLRVRAGEPSIREISKRATANNLPALPRSTLGQILSGERFPSKEQLLTLVRVCDVEDEAQLDRWESAWRQVADQNRYGALTAAATAPPVSALLEAGSEQAGVLLLRRAIPEAAAELSKLGPGDAARILQLWPRDLGADIIAAMDPRSAASLLVSIGPSAAGMLVARMRINDALACIELMGRSEAARILTRTPAAQTAKILDAMPTDRADKMRFTRKVRRTLTIAKWAGGLAVGSAIYLLLNQVGYLWEQLEASKRALQLRELDAADAPADS